MEDAVTKLVVDFYLKSNDFNGIRLDALIATAQGLCQAAQADMMDVMAKLARDGKITLAFSSVFVNPHIKAFADLPPEEQVERLQKEKPSTICVYPTEAVIRSTIDVGTWDDRPFTKKLLLGQPQLTPMYFDLHVLDRYYSDPRYYYSFNDYDGWISVSDDYFESEQMPERDQTLLQTFGVGYDPSGHRVVVVFLRYLSDLSPEHQQVWLAHIRTDKCKMVYEYYQNSILAEWAECLSTYQAVMEELKLLNELAKAIGKPQFFREEYDDRPREFAALLRPTRKSYLGFIHVFDKMLSENLNREFFAGDVPFEEHKERTDGKVVVSQKGTLTLLDEWLRKTVRFPDEEPYENILGPLREVRKLRQRPAHSVIADDYSMDYIRQQDDLVQRVHHALAGLCIVLSTHPRAKASGFVLPDWLENNKVKSY